MPRSSSRNSRKRVLSQPDPSTGTPSTETARTPALPDRGAGGTAGLGRALAARESSVALVLLIIFAMLLVRSDRATFYNAYNLENLLRNIALLAIFAIGETIVIIIGGIDLSL